ncbi:putative bifunctional diguanylate cyclase/phosphodiesterase [Qipengyuania spongiae]|uniref:EAL domain-containing protein n=1 Tax=Qipengyuania spongiae TaxID=2909673 RepID=A0ABY5SVJ2_9SPHN|nr:EAL domain-containing protein [Qipengyuania spongiae]UVI38573.1 EAL domain-containing protein [Qipengyuania spongiae]
MSEGSKTFREAVSEKFSRSRKPERDVVALGIAFAAMILFVGTGGKVIPQLVAAWRGIAVQPDLLLTNALILNVALIILGCNRYRSLHRELLARRVSEEEARRLADIDPLTNCYNRRSFGPAMERQLAAARENGRAVSVILVDLDNFKQVNDINGHSVGDRVLQTAAERMADTLPADALLARLGGDEFACSVFHAPSNRDGIERLAARLIDRVGKPIDTDDLSIDVTISVGIASSDIVDREQGAPASPQQIMQKADIAMYQAKKAGKNRQFWFEPSMEYELRFRNELESGIRRGIAKGEFVPYYEQQIDLDTGKLVGFEMLARWHSPDLGTVNPDIFIPVAEDIGVIAQLSESLIAQTIEDAKQWHPSLTISVNISPVQLRDPWFSQKLLKILVQHNFPPSRLEIEITESCLHDDIGLVRTMISSLRNQGMRISLDDFGTGYSSLAQLRSLPFDRLKIDRSFIREVHKSQASSKLVDAIVSMGDGLDMPITAEGIESGEILAALKRVGRLKGQGYHYGRPEPAEEVTKRLAEASLLAEDADPAPAPAERHSAAGLA